MASDRFDKTIGALTGLPDVLATPATTVRAAIPLVGNSQTFIIQTFRQRDIGDTIFLEHVDDDGAVRLVVPPQVAAVIARQRDALTGRARRRAAKAVAEDRKARGILPGFMRKPRGGRKAGGK